MYRVKIALVVNPKSGAGRGSDDLAARLRGPGRDIEVFTLDDVDEAASSGADRVVVAGGDGSMGPVFAACAKTGASMAILPAGTANDFARAIGIPSDFDEAIEVAVDPDARHRTVWGATLDGHPFVNVASIGLAVNAAREAAPYKSKLGPLAYAMGAVITGVVGKGIRASVTVDGQPVHSPRRLIQVAVGNGRYVGGGAPLLPEADPFDGSLDVAVVWAHARWKRLAYAWRLRRGRHPMRDDVVYLKVHEVTVTGESTPANLDGEIASPSTRHAWRVEPGRLRLRAPAGAPPDLPD